VSKVLDWRDLLLALTDLGDTALLIPLAAAVLVWLVSASPRSAGWWVISVGVCVSITALFKILLFGCPPASDMRSPSGHTAFSILVYGAIALAAAIQARGWRRALAIAFGAVLVLTITTSRLLLHVHSLPEVSLGWVIGAASLILFGREYLLSSQPRVWPLLVAVGLLVTILHGQELHAEESLHRITEYLGIHCS
jgi:membrane-associated phospholipid phosphatase